MVSGAGLIPGHQRPVGLPAPPHLSKEREQRQVWQVQRGVNVVAVPSVQSTPSFQLHSNPRCVGEKTREKNAFSDRDLEHWSPLA